MKPQQTLVAFLLAVLVATVTACASLGPTTAPQTPKQRLAYVDSQFTAAVETAIDLRKHGILTDKHIEQLRPLVTKGHAALTIAWGAVGKDNPEGALEYIAIVNEVLFAINGILKEAQGEQSGSRA